MKISISKHSLTYSFVLLLFLLNSCENKLDILPEQDLTEELVFSSPATTLSALRGVYSTAQTLDFYGSLPQVIAEYMADNVNFVGTFPTLQDLNNYTAVSVNSNVAIIWQMHYQVVTRANKVIDNVPNVPNLTNQIREQYIAEAKFLRALAYFQLANLFSQPYQFSNGTNMCVPLVLQDFAGGNIEFPGRSTLNEVHQQILSDLIDAVEGLPVNYTSISETRGRATIGAAYALLSRYYLYREDWNDAINAARNVLEIGNYALADNYDFFNGNTPEDVFTIQNSAIDNGRTGAGGWANYYMPASSGGRGDAPISENLIAAFESENNDLRFQLRMQGQTAGIDYSFNTKFPDAINNSDNSPVLRCTEVYLNLAEALAHQSDFPNIEAVEIINTLRRRAGLNNLEFTNQQQLINAILIERRKELAFEGHRRMDLLRNRLALRSNNAAANFGADRTILPIPQREIDNNIGLQGQQNPGY